MGSTYGYLTETNLEVYSGLDYSVINAVFDTAAVEGAITTVEELINTILGVDTAQTVTNKITSAVKFGSVWQMNHLIRALGITFESTVYDMTWDKMYEMLEKILYEPLGVDSIPMSGANK